VRDSLTKSISSCRRRTRKRPHQLHVGRGRFEPVALAAVLFGSVLLAAADFAVIGDQIRVYRFLLSLAQRGRIVQCASQRQKES